MTYIRRHQRDLLSLCVTLYAITFSFCLFDSTDMLAEVVEDNRATGTTPEPSSEDVLMKESSQDQDSKRSKAVKQSLHARFMNFTSLPLINRFISSRILFCRCKFTFR